MNAVERADSGFFRLFFRLKWRLADNHLRYLHRHMWIHLAIALASMGIIVGGGTLSFRMAFKFMMEDLEVFGPLLMDHLIKMVLLAFFSMLIFSNLIIMLTTTYLSREVEFLMSQPISHRRLFFGKLAESIFYSSWAFVVLALPMFVALGQSQKGLPWTFYPGAALLIFPFLIIPASVGALVVLAITVYCPPRQLIRFALAMIAIGIAGALLAQRAYGLSAMIGVTRGQSENEQLGRLMRVMSLGDLVVLPSGWLGRGLTALRSGDWIEARFWGMALWSTAAMGLVACDWLAGPLYFKGWCSARSSGTTSRRRKVGFFGWFRRLLAPLPSATRALVSKDLAVFWRDPAQWGQLMILFGLLYIYIMNLRSAAGLGQLEHFFPFWRTLVALFNIGATTFVLSILTTRFVYPMLSLEGKQQWVIGLAPMPRTRLVWVKFMVSWLSSTVLTLPLALLSSYMLQTERSITLMSVVTVLAMSAGLSALAVGLGALMPNFNDDNPARIASGLGGTINAIVSLIYIGSTLALEAPWVHAQIHDRVPTETWMRLLYWTSIPAWIILQVAMIVIPMSVGLRRWRRMEF